MWREKSHWTLGTGHWALGIVLLAVAGCCGPEHRLEDMRSRELATPYDAVDFFRTAVRYGDWEAVYEALSPRTKEWVEKEIGRFGFETFAGGLKYKRLDKNAPPEVADLTLEELIHRSQIVTIESEDRRRWRVQLYYKPIPPAKTNFPLVKVGEGKTVRWTIGLYEWMQELAP